MSEISHSDGAYPDGAGQFTDMNYPVYIIFADQTLDEIKEELQNPDIIKIIRREGRDTNRYMCLMGKDTYEMLSQMELDFDIYSYNLYDHHFPGPGHTNNLYIPLPRGKTASTYRARLKELLSKFIDHDFFTFKQYRIIIPTHSKTTGEIVGSCFIVFDDDVPVEAIAYVKVLLQDMDWGSDLPGKKIKCLWAHDRE